MRYSWIAGFLPGAIRRVTSILCFQTSRRGISIPIDRLTFNFSRSSGPGGQNVNKVNTKAEIRFMVASADWCATEIHAHIYIWLEFIYIFRIGYQKMSEQG
jgi:hypothetical protein